MTIRPIDSHEAFRLPTEALLDRICYSTIRDIEIMSHSFFRHMSNFPICAPEQFPELLQYLFSTIKVDGISKGAQASFLSFQKSLIDSRCNFRTTLDLCGTQVVKLDRFCVQNLLSYAHKIRALDEDGKKQLIRDADRGLFEHRVRPDYIRDHFSTKSIRDEAWAFEMKVRFHNLCESRNKHLLPQNDLPVLKELMARDLNLLNAFPNLLQTSKKAVLIAIAHFQSKSNDSDLKLDLSLLSESLENDRDIFRACVKSPRTVYLLQFASEKLRANADFFQCLVKKRGDALRFADPALKDNPDLVITAVQNDLGAYAHAGLAAQNSDVIKKMVEALQWIPARQRLPPPNRSDLPCQTSK